MLKNFYGYMFFSAICIFNNIFAYGVDKKENYIFESSELSISSLKFERVIQNDDSKLIIQLNDGSQWFVISEFIDDLQKVSEAFAASFDLWNIGDDIIINKNNLEIESNPGKRIKLSESEYVLKNARNNQVFFVELNYNMWEQVKNSSIEKIDNKGYFVTTENKVDWEINWFDSWATYKWRVGDKIIIARADKIFMEEKGNFTVIKDCSNKYGDNYLLINLNARNSAAPSIVKWK
ncbi:MAG: hypothetical protein WCT85_07175 [Parachlamydiales bacterium]